MKKKTRRECKTAVKQEGITFTAKSITTYKKKTKEELMSC